MLPFRIRPATERIEQAVSQSQSAAIEVDEVVEQNADPGTAFDQALRGPADVLARIEPRQVRAGQLDRIERAADIRAMAELGEGPHRSGDIATLLGRIVSSLAPTRALLIKKGMVWSPAHGETAFTVSLFHEFMKRAMPGNDWRSY